MVLRGLRRLLGRGAPVEVWEASGPGEVADALASMMSTDAVKAYARMVVTEAERSPAYVECLEQVGSERGPCVLACAAYAAGADESLKKQLSRANAAIAGRVSGPREARRISRDFKRLEKILRAAVKECLG